MSWDIFVQDLPPDAKSISDIPDDFSPGAIGRRSEMIARIRQIVPVDFLSSGWGTIEGEGWSIDVSIGTEEECRHLAFHVYGGGEAADVVAAILEHLGLRALDPLQPGGLFVARPQARASFARWQAYRNQVTGRRPE